MSIQRTSEFRHATNLLRGMCSLAILIWHYQHFFFIGAGRSAGWDPSIQPLWRLLRPGYIYGEFAVQIFWCISGLILAHTYINQDNVVIRFGSQEVYPTQVDATGLANLSNYMRGTDVRIHVSLATGTSDATVWGCDLTDGYVRINADYTT